MVIYDQFVVQRMYSVNGREIDMTLSLPIFLYDLRFFLNVDDQTDFVDLYDPSFFELDADPFFVLSFFCKTSDLKNYPIYSVIE